MSKLRVLIVGGVAGGASAAARLRRLDEKAEIILFEKGEYISFANCGLPYYIGGTITNKKLLTLQTPASFCARFNIDVRIHSEAIAIDPKQKNLTIKNLQTGQQYIERYDKLILSPGAQPIKPPIQGVDCTRVFTLRNIPDTYQIKDYITQNQPKRAAVVGGGYIGVEMAENLHAAGIEVTLIEMQNQVIAPLDFDMAAEIHRHIKDKGVHLMLETAVSAIQEAPEGLSLTVSGGTVETDMVIMAIGVKPDTSIAQLAGINCNQRGALVVSDEMLTSDPDIYAVGDAVEVTDFITQNKVMIPLAGPANRQGRLAADHICGQAGEYTGTQGSAILKVFDMTVATTGINERTAKAIGLDCDKSFTYSASHAAYYPGAQGMSVKTVFEKKTGKILGAQIVGFEGVDKRCDVLATAMRFGATAEDLTKLELCYAPPYSSAKDPVNMAGFVIQNLLTGKVKQFHWHDIKDLPTDGSAILLDTRTPEEYNYRHIDGFMNIPVDELRHRLDELDHGKPVYVTCQIGLRGYMACRILSQHGFICYNLSGGYRLYDMMFGE